MRCGIELLADGAVLAGRLGLNVPVPPSRRLAARHASIHNVSLARAREIGTLREFAAGVVRKLLPSRAFLRLYDPHAGHGALSMVRAYVRRWAWVFLGAAQALVKLGCDRVRPKCDRGRERGKVSAMLHWATTLTGFRTFSGLKDGSAVATGAATDSSG